MRIRRKPSATPRVTTAFRRFREVAEEVEEAKATLLLGIPSGRSPRIPLAEALAGFEASIARAEEGMGGWREPEVEPEWEACRRALEQAADGAGRLRLGPAPQSYEHVAPMLDALLEPFGAFAAAARRFRELGA